MGSCPQGAGSSFPPGPPRGEVVRKEERPCQRRCSRSLRCVWFCCENGFVYSSTLLLLGLCVACKVFVIVKSAAVRILMFTSFFFPLRLGLKVTQLEHV